MSSDPVTVAAVEGGGMAFCVAVARLNSQGQKPTIVHHISIDSSDKDLKWTIWECCTFLKGSRPPGGYAALGLAIFGPVGVDPECNTYGCILSSSPKKAWHNINILQPLIEACQGLEWPLAVRVETDVNAPSWAEYELTKQENPSILSLAYVTVRTGVGVGMVVNDLPVHGRMHPEHGHVPVQPLEGDSFPGYSWGLTNSPFGGKHTVEGIAGLVALTE